MRKLLAGCLFLLVGIPFNLSFIASYYLQNHFAENIAADIDIQYFDFNHGWLQSTAKVDFNLKEHNLVIQTQNNIHHGLVIWKLLFKHPAKAFCLYKIDTRFNLISKTNSQPMDSESGTAETVISYTGSTNPIIQHPGLNLSLFNSKIFADLPTIESNIRSDGSLQAKFSGNQLEIKDGYQNIYLTDPKLELTLDAKSEIPSQLQVSALQLSGLIGSQRLQTDNVVLASAFKQTGKTFSISTTGTADSLKLSQAVATEVGFNFLIDNLNPELINYISTNYSELSFAIQNNQWLVLLKHLSELIELANINQPEFLISINSLYDRQKVDLNFSGQLLANNETQLNPFSLLENIEMNLDVDIPIKMIDEIKQPDLINFFQLMHEKGLLTKKDESYHAKLIFENAKIKIAHSLT